MHPHTGALAITVAIVTGIAALLFYDHNRPGHPPAIPDPSPPTRVTPPPAAPRPPLHSPAAIAPPPAPHTTVYRCTSADGTRYQDTPCPDGSATAPLDGGTLSVVSPYPVTVTNNKPTPPTSRMGGINRSDTPNASPQCRQLVQRQARIESEQRAGASGWRMDRLTRDWHATVRDIERLSCSRLP